MIGSVEPEICTKMLRNSNEGLAQLPATTRGYAIVNIAHLHDAFSEFFELGASQNFCSFRRTILLIML